MFHQQALRRLSRSATDDTFNNPVLPGFNPDPSVIRVGRDYFLTTSSFEFTPGAPIYHSTDLIQWQLIGHALTRKSQLDIKAPEPGGGVWACTLRYHKGWYYLTTCVWDRYRPQDTTTRSWPQGFYVCTQDIWNSESWSDPIFFDQPGFDQDLFFDDDDKVYLSTTHERIDRDPDSEFKDFGIHLCEIDLKSGNSISKSSLIRESKFGRRIAEGSHLFKRNGMYFLFVAEGGTESGHSECVYRSKTGPLGPWEECPHNPVLHNSTEEEVQNVGHCDLVEGVDGRWWAVCLAVRPIKTSSGWLPSNLGRETFLMLVSWSEDDWPQFNGGKALAVQGKARGLYVYDLPQKWRDNFQASHLQLGWYFKNTPPKSDTMLSLTEKPAHLRLHGGPYDLNSSGGSPTAIFRKQLHRECVWRTGLSFFPDSSEHVEAGTCVYMNYLTWSSIGIQGSQNGQRRVVFTSTTGDTSSVGLEKTNSEIVLLIQCEAARYRFGFEEVTGGVKSAKSPGKGVVWIGEMNMSTFVASPAVGMPFTGAVFGLYAFAHMQRCLTPADFSYAEVLELTAL